MRRFNDIADRVLEYNPSSDLGLLQKAYVYSAKVHEGQERLSGEPYLVHPLDVAGILADMRLDEVTVAAGLLHDTVEDTLTNVGEIQRRFGEEVAFLVEGVTKIAKVEFKSHRVRQAENFRKMLIAMSKDIRILLIKLADRLHNMRTLEYLSEDARRRIAEETLDIYAPLAQRLGIDWIRRELEELAFRALKPEIAADLERKLRTGRRARKRYIEEVISLLSARLADGGVAAEVTGRRKDLHSIYNKMESQQLALDDIHDVIAFRVVVDGPWDSVYHALGVIHGLWAPVQGRFKDYVALPKPNGYQSLHTVVIGPYGERMEVQIRTQEMHRMAEFGIAAHWKYKEGRVDGDPEIERKFAWLRQLMHWQQELDDPHEFLDAVTVDLFPDEVYVFTPRGEVHGLPRGATPVDFAYAIHSEIGDHCAGARVNGKLVSLRHALRDGDTVEILTSASQFPRKDWLEFVVSGKARNRVRHAVRAAEKARSREIGRDLVERELRRAGLSLARLLERGELDPVAAAEVRGGGVDDLFAAVGYGRVAASAVVRRLRPETAPPRPARRPKRARPSSSSGIRVSGMGDVLARTARCCNPIPGDDVVGFVTRGRGVTVHLSDCRKIFELDPARRIDVRWEDADAQPRSVRIRVVSENKPGLLSDVTGNISAAGINIDGAQVTTSHGLTANHFFDLRVRDAASLNQVMQRIERVRGVLSVERVRT